MRDGISWHEPVEVGGGWRLQQSVTLHLGHVRRVNDIEVVNGKGKRKSKLLLWLQTIV